MNDDIEWLGFCICCGQPFAHPRMVGAICDMLDGKERVDAKCPYHEVIEPATRYSYYDTVRDFFDCGADIDYGYGYWREPESVTKERNHQKYLRRKARRLAAVTA